MQYITTPEQEKFRQIIRKLAEERVAPRSAEIDRTGEFPQDIFDLFKANKIFGLHLPKECGGTDEDMITCCIFSEEMCRVDTGCSNMVTSSWPRFYGVACFFPGIVATFQGLYVGETSID